MAKKKEKIIYIDDGRTIADMSGVGGSRIPRRESWMPHASLKEQLGPFWNAMKLMFLPTLAVCGGIVVIYIVLYILFSVI